MNKLIKSFLEDNIAVDYCNEKFDYSFSHNSSVEIFKTEFKKFLALYNSVFYFKNRLVTAYNSYEIRINITDIKHLFNLYLYADKNKFEYESILLLEFLYTYFNTINTNDYKNNYKDYDKAKKDFKLVLDELKMNKVFFTTNVNQIYEFYKELLKYGIKNDIFIDGPIINRIFNNLWTKKTEYDELIDLLAKNSKNLCNIIDFDRKIEQHTNEYLDYIIESLHNFGGYNCAKEILFKIDKENKLNKSNLNRVINAYIDVVNSLCRQLKDKQTSFIRGLSDIDNLKKELIYILQNIESMNDIQKKKIKECLKYLLRLKRYILSDDNYVKSEMHSFGFEEKISKKRIDKYKKTLLNNIYNLYSASKINFTDDVGLSLESYAKYPLQSMVSSFHIDSVNQVYSRGIKGKNIENSNFKRYYDEIGREYTLSHPKLLNKLSSNFYEELLRYVSKAFMMHQSFNLSLLGYDNFRKIISQLKEKISHKIDNDYAVVVGNILAIETNVAKILELNNIEVSLDGYNNINALFDLYNEKDKKDGIMYLNYILYEKTGLNLRNNMMHGVMINSDLNVALLVSFSGLIFISWLLNEK